ncbi:hypothetical protein AHAS_Ahas13G0338600 [Arachis hypogaea]
MKNEVMEVFEPETPYPQRLLEVIEEHENSLPKDSMENHEEEREEDNQESPHSIEAESYIEEGFIERPMQEAFDEEDTPTITQHLSLDIQEVKATNKNTEKRIGTKIPRTTFMKKKRSRQGNKFGVPTPT